MAWQVGTSDIISGGYTDRILISKARIGHYFLLFIDQQKS
jgi:hypothetical protein